MFSGAVPFAQITVERVPLEDDRVKASLEALKKKKVKLVDMPADYAAQMGDACMVNMKVRLPHARKH
jgi:FKBP-type peptidyl-prolyl cis-trans isomerase (trigger factor)